VQANEHAGHTYCAFMLVYRYLNGYVVVQICFKWARLRVRSHKWNLRENRRVSRIARRVASLSHHQPAMSSESEVKESKKRKRVDDDPILLATIATPLADRKLTKRLLKLVKQSTSHKHNNTILYTSRTYIFIQ
jgi:hypothetical protein